MNKDSTKFKNVSKHFEEKNFKRSEFLTDLSSDKLGSLTVTLEKEDIESKLNKLDRKE